ncbi:MULTISPECIES: peroxiredoxin [Idiomarina]|jgi:peroxiredoxin|uniref:Glutathione-dependent peroxiredoxin n=1 Tax=Idiomarina aquatica TaxID=1327752 RepID=A0AA94ED68_9GAMM|nr:MULTISPECIES: peroxiredoxin [Idiomarina]RUO40366.1 peroxiredoxin [Idiomarina aquatica]
MIKENDQLPTGALTSKGDLGIQHYDPREIFAKGRHIIFAVPGAFTPTCSEKHLPGYVELADAFKNKGVQSINCISVNDAFVMKAWGDALGIGDKVRLLSDGNGAYSEALGLANDTGAFGGIRSKRYAMVVEDGIVEHLFVEDEKQFEVSKAEYVLDKLTA